MRLQLSSARLTSPPLLVPTETKHIKKVTVKTQFCWLYVVMCLLVLVLAVLVFMRWG